MADDRSGTNVKVKGAWVVEDYRNLPQDEVIGWRREVRDGHIFTFAVLKRPGRRGGTTRLTSIWHPLTESQSSNTRVQRMLDAAREARMKREAIARAKRRRKR